MKRVFIDRIVIDADCVDPRDAGAFRERLQDEIGKLLPTENFRTGASRMRIDAGELPRSGSRVSPRAVAERVAQSLGGKR